MMRNYMISIIILNMAVIKGPNNSVTWRANRIRNQTSPLKIEISKAKFKISSFISTFIASRNIIAFVGVISRPKPVF